jgi:hypothetical protein
MEWFLRVISQSSRYWNEAKVVSHEWRRHFVLDSPRACAGFRLFVWRHGGKEARKYFAEIRDGSDWLPKLPKGERRNLFPRLDDSGQRYFGTNHPAAMIRKQAM